MRLLELAEPGALDRGPGRALLEATMGIGFSESVARAGLTAELEAWAAPGALEAARAELPPDLDPARLPGTVLIIAARTLPAGAMREVLLARLVGARVLVKPARGQEAFARAIAAADPAIEARLFTSDDAAARDRAIAQADAVVVLGSDRTVEVIRDRVPLDRAFAGYGHKLSVAWLADTGEAALDGLADDLVAWDQAGCLSPHVAWVVGGDRATLEDVGRRLAAVLRRVERSLPMTLSPEAVRARWAARTLGDMTGASFETRTALIVALPRPVFRPSPGFRTLWLLPADRAALDALRPVLSTIGYVGPPDQAPHLPGVRTAPLGTMQRPPLTWHHDGRPSLPTILRPARR